MKVPRLTSFLFFIIAASQCSAQWFQKTERKSGLYGGWGWNRASFTESDIHFTGDDYDFTLKNVKAKDRQTPYSRDVYFGLKTMTIPQTNFRLGYFFRNNLAVTFGVDHMKYVMIQNQTVGIEGRIDDDAYSHLIQNNEITLTDNFLLFEHTDGLNYINTELEYFQNIFASKPFTLNAIGGAGLGALLPKSNVTLMNYPRNDEFHLAGYGLSAKFAMEFLFWKHFFIRFEYKTGYINMPDIVTRKASIDDRASQHFFFAQRNGIFGFAIPLHKTNKVKTD